jgi:23S rRNA (pseudouridine1915-N3)-methyltransferase
MTAFTIISVGRLKESYFVAAVDEYVKRIGGFGKVQMIDLPDSPKEKDVAAGILAKIPQGAFVFALCVEGKQLSSEKFAEKLQQIYLSEKKGICFLIGGSDGLPDDVKAVADMKLSMSEMTFPHRLAKIMLTEQLYRALTIQNNKKYHK